MHRTVPHGVHVVERESDNASDTQLINFMHAESLDAERLDQDLLARIDVAQADVHDAVGGEPWRGRGDPGEFGEDGVVDSEQKGEGHAVHVPCHCCLYGVDVSVCIDPDDAGIRILTVEMRLFV